MRTGNKVLAGFIFFCALFYSLFNSSVYAQEFDNVKKSTHFIIYYQEAPANYVGKLISRLEYYYKSITHYLGFKRFDFWTWDNRCKIYLYPDQDEYLKNTGTFAWSRAHVNVMTREISTYIGQDHFFDVILPHEMGHIVFREMVGFDKALPLWLDEGVACMQEAQSYERMAIARNLVKLGLHLPFIDLMAIGNYNVAIPLIFYNQSASVIDFLLTNYGRSNFVNFCRKLRDGNNWEASLLRTYKLKDLHEFEKQWTAYMLE
jgi:hypothetical protein